MIDNPPVPVPAAVVPSPSPVAVASPQDSALALEDRQLLVEQYKLAVEMADGMSNKRHSANGFYMGLLSAFGVLYSLLDKSPASPAREAWQYSLPIIAFVLCVMWRLNIQSYRRLNAAKWSVIVELETKLPAAPFANEWERLGDANRKHTDLTTIEAAVPILVGLVFLLLALQPFLLLIL